MKLAVKRSILAVATVVPLLLAGCTEEVSQPTPQAKVKPTPIPSETVWLGTSQDSPSLPGPAKSATDHYHRINVWHCGIETTTFAGRDWETAWPPPFDATNAPRPYNEPEDGRAFTGNGTMELVADREAVYTDDGGVVLTFRPAGTPGFGTPDDFICY